MFIIHKDRMSDFFLLEKKERKTAMTGKKIKRNAKSKKGINFTTEGRNKRASITCLFISVVIYSGKSAVCYRINSFQSDAR